MLRELISLVAPPLCGLCGAACAPREPLCAGCGRALRRARAIRTKLPSGLEVVSAAAYEGVAGRLVAAMKFSGRVALAAAAAEAMCRAAGGATCDAGIVVPVPASPGRARARGFDLAYTLAGEVHARIGGAFAYPLSRQDGPRQVGRSRADRLADPPRIRSSRCAGAVLLVDDVLTTGATLGACAGALREAGAGEVRAVTFARA